MVNKGDSVKLGLVGCGLVTQQRHLPTLQSLPGAEVVAVADTNPDRLRQVADAFDIDERYGDYRAMLEEATLDAVAILVPPLFHAEIALAALDAGKHVFIEKPLALNLDDCDRLIERAARTTSKVMVGFNMRWHRLVRQAREIMQRGILGQINSIRSVYTHWRVREDTPRWTMERHSGGGVVLNEAVHHFDLWRFLLQGEVKEVFAISQSSPQHPDETATVTARMESGVLASGVFSLKTNPNNELEIYGEAGRLYVSCYRFDGLEFYPITSLAGDLRTRLKRSIQTLKELPQGVAGLFSGGDFVASYPAQWRHFLECIQQDAEPACTLQDGRQALQVALAVLDSAHSGRPTQVSRAPRGITPIAEELPHG